MRSKFIERLDELIGLAKNPIEAACLKLEKASYHARRGDYRESSEIVCEIRTKHQHVLDTRVAAWINFAEGMKYHTSGNDTDAKMKWGRSVALAKAGAAHEVLARALSWLALIDYTELKVKSLKDNTRSAIAALDEGNYEASARLTLTTAQIFHVCGDYARARMYYEKCRMECLKCSDDIMLAALIHNMAWLRLSNQRNEILQGRQITDSPYIIEALAESTKSYEKLIGSNGLDVMTPLLDAQVHMLLGRFADAIEIFNSRLESVNEQGLSRLKATLISDRAFCRAELGDTEGAKLDAAMAIESITDRDHSDDLAVLYSRVSRVYELANEKDISSDFKRKAKEFWNDFGSLQKYVLSEMDGLHNLGL